jgi:hypothetical protein
MFLLALLAGALAAEQPLGVTPVPARIREQFKLSPYYKKYLDVGGMPIVASDKVSNFALWEARFLVEQMIAHRPSLLAAIAKNHVRLAIMAPSEFTTDIPEHSDLTPKDYWDRRARGVGARAPRLAVSCGEENLLGYRGDPYPTESTLIHEFGHVVHESGMAELDPTFDGWLQDTFELARRDGLWAGTYAGSNRWEYWAVGVQAWFDARHDDDGVNTRAHLKHYDPRLAELLTEVFGDLVWRYVRPGERTPPSSYLVGYNPGDTSVFAWPKHLETATGDRDGKGWREATLIRVAPGARIDWRSPRDTESTMIQFENTSSATVQVEWIDFEGRPQPYATLRQGERAQISTHAGAFWRASNEAGWVLGYFVAEPLPSTAVIASAAGPSDY